MKKIVSILALAALLVTGCSQTKTNEEQLREELKEEIKAELAAEQAAAEGESQAQTEQAQESTDADQSITPEVAKLDIRDESAITSFIISNFEVEMEKDELQEGLAFEYVDLDKDGQDEVIAYMPVKAGYYNLAVIGVNDDAYNLIESDLEPFGMSDHKIEIVDDFILYSSKATGTGVSSSFTSIYTYHDNKLFFTDASLVYEGYESQPPMEKYPEGYSTERIGKTTFLEGENNYNHFSHFEEQTGNFEWQTDKVYSFNAETGKYEIEVRVDTLNNPQDEGEDQNASSDTLDPATIKVGQPFGGLKVVEVDYSKNNSLMLDCEGEVQVEGLMSSHIDGMTDERVFTFEATSPMFDQPLVYYFGDWKMETKGFKGYVLNAKDFLDEGTQNYLADGNNLKVSVAISRYHHGYADGTEGGEWIKANAIQIQADENFIGYTESRQGDKPRDMMTETFPTEDGDVVVDYSEYLCVVLPMWPTANESKLETQTVHIGEEYINTLSFTVIGEIQNLQVQNVFGMDTASEWVDLGTVKNTKVLVEASLPSDMSRVKVKGRVHLGEGTYENVEFTLDDMRDMSAYDIIMVQ